MRKDGKLLGFHGEQQQGKYIVKPAGTWLFHPLHTLPAALPLELHHVPPEPHLPDLTFRKLASGTDPTASTAAQVSPSIVVIIIVLTVIFFLSAFLHLLIRWLARNPALIRRSLRAGANGGSGGPNNRIIALTALQGQLQQLFSIQDAGLERSLIDELPVFSYKAAMGGLKEGADCAICLCEFVGDDQLRLLPSCGHAFHTDCIDTWLLSHSTCPLCRTLLLPECWLPGSLQPLLSSDISTVGEMEHQQSAIDATVTVPSSRSGGLGSSSRRSSLGRHSIIDQGSMRRTQVDQIWSHDQQSATPHLLSQDGNISSDPAESGASGDANSVARATRNSARFATFEREKSLTSVDSCKFDASSETGNHVYHAAKMNSGEGTSAALLNPMISSSAATALCDSGRLSYTSYGNHADAQSERYSNRLLEQASAYGSGRRVPVHLGKCRVVNEHSRRTRKPRASPRRSYSKGSYEYVIDGSSNLEVLIPSHSRANTLMSSSRLNDLLNLSHRVSSSLGADAPTQARAARNANTPCDFGCRSSSPSWASPSFRKLRLCNGRDTDASNIDQEEMNATLHNTLQPSEKAADCGRWGADVPKRVELEESSTATSMRANIGSDASFSSDSESRNLRDLNVLGKFELSQNSHELESSKQAVSFRLPTPASHYMLSAKLRASASRRALSESDEALSFWEPCLTAEERSMQLSHHQNDNRMLMLDEKVGSHRSSSFAKRTMDWLVGWPRRMVHPDKGAANSG